jgi:hypothetical protein
MGQRHQPDGGTDSIEYFLSREYEDYLDWLENHGLPTDGRRLAPLRRTPWGGWFRAYFGLLFAGCVIGAICVLF